MEIIIIVLLMLVIVLLIYLIQLSKKDSYVAESNPNLNPNPKNNLEQDYLSCINKASDNNKLTLTRHCFNRLPDSFPLLQRLWETTKEKLSEDIPPIIQREYIADINDAVTLYRKNCDINSLNKADSIVEELEKYSKNILDKLKEEEHMEMAKLVDKLESSIGRLSNNKENKELLKEIEKIDTKINKDRLENFPELKTRYDKCSSKLMASLNNAHEEKSDKTKEYYYNKKAIDFHKEALDNFNSEKGVLNKSYNLEKIVRLVGGWDSRYLYPSTLTYTNTVYMSIFSKLKPHDQFRITELMIQAKQKTLSQVY